MSLLSSLFTPKPNKLGRVTIEFDANNIDAAVFAGILQDFAWKPGHAECARRLLQTATITHNDARGDEREKIARMISDLTPAK
jgi:hypothetical protein